MTLVLRAEAVLLKFTAQAGLLDDANRQLGAYRASMPTIAIWHWSRPDHSVTTRCGSIS